MATALNAEFLRELSYIAEDEGMMKKLSHYVHRLFEKKQDETLFTEEEYFRRLDEAEKGATYKMLPNENLDEMLVRLGYV